MRQLFEGLAGRKYPLRARRVTLADVEFAAALRVNGAWWLELVPRQE
jgi:hypothetical protein